VLSLEVAAIILVESVTIVRYIFANSTGDRLLEIKPDIEPRFWEKHVKAQTVSQIVNANLYNRAVWLTKTLLPNLGAS
jgi:hypothetical protein